MALALALDGVFTDEPRRRATPARGWCSPTASARPTSKPGPLDAPPIVLVHGLGATNASMLTLLWELARGLSRPVSRSAGPWRYRGGADTYDAEFLARWLLAFLDATQLEQPFLIGNSLGGRTALEAALIAPERFSGLVLLTPAMAFRKLRQFIPLVNVLRPELARMPMRSRQDGRARLEGHVRRAAPGAQCVVRRGRRRVRPRDADARPPDRVLLRAAPGLSRRGVRRARLLGAGCRGWRRPRFSSGATRDRLVPSGFARHVEHAVPAATSVMLESCGHVPHFEHPERTVELIRDFLTAVCAPAKPPAGATRSRAAVSEPRAKPARNGPSRERAGGPSRARAQRRVVGGPPAEITGARAGHGRARPRLHPRPAAWPVAARQRLLPGPGASSRPDPGDRSGAAGR